MPSMRIGEEVAGALAAGRPVVALESAVITAGLPREPLADPPAPVAEGWRSSDPMNLETARAMQRIVRAEGAVPATIALVRGVLHIGLNDNELARLAGDRQAGKVSTHDLAHEMASGATAGTTVAATVAACAMPPRVDPELGVIRFFATGGIGGVHRGWTERPDVSADLAEIAHSPVAVVSSGAKSMLDLPATLEVLESLGVPVIGLETDAFPQFYARGDASMPLKQSVASAPQAAARCRQHWDILGRSGGLLLANPVPAEYGMDRNEVERAVARAERAAGERDIVGPDRTPYVLAELARLTDGRALAANLALLAGNARQAAAIAVAFGSERATTGQNGP